MKKIVASLSAFFLVLSVPSVIAQMPLSIPAMPAASLVLERIGVVAAAQGKVELTTPGQIGRIAQSGQVIFMGDEVTTDAKGQLQILLLDETVFKIGPNSSIIIDKFVYDPKTSAGEIKASITKGVFRYVSGKIAAKNPDSVKVKLPTATIGFRGTIVGGSVEPSGQGLVGLLGPGDNNDSGARIGSFTIDGEGGGQQEVNRSGFGVEVGADGGISGPFQLSDDQINGLTGGLGGGDQGGGAGLGGDSNMGDLSGENNALVGANTLLLGGLESFSDSLNDVSVIGAQDARNQNGLGNPNGTTRVSDLSGLSGSYSYSGSGSFYQTLMSGSQYTVVGSFSASWVLNLATAQLENISIIIDTTTAQPTNGNIDPAYTGTADVTHSIPAADLLVFSGLHDPNNSNIQAEITISNVNGQVAQSGTINVVYNDNATTYANAGNGTLTADATPSV